jgi:hypothetical protein
VAVERLSLEVIDQIGKPLGFRIKIRMVDLANFSRHNNLHGVSGAGDEGLYLVRREILRFIDNKMESASSISASINSR